MHLPGLMCTYRLLALLWMPGSSDMQNTTGSSLIHSQVGEGGGDGGGTDWKRQLLCRELCWPSRGGAGTG